MKLRALWLCQPGARRAVARAGPDPSTRIFKGAGNDFGIGAANAARAQGLIADEGLVYLRLRHVRNP